jgi:hypothetical protein
MIVGSSVAFQFFVVPFSVYPTVPSLSGIDLAYTLFGMMRCNYSTTGHLLHVLVYRPTVQVNPSSVDATRKPCSKSGLRVYDLLPTGRTDKSGCD